ncbi:sugar-binding domain protein [Klebsiella pneumoniae]|uniref:Sugar-binding domain protein n=1 Tax=Klebsiella pneumoniae TaxID=573 RepID=A0A4P0YFF8_KLEPN|nr:sugar-binding domain protein [Klebsiella pneumoniae]
MAEEKNGVPERCSKTGECISDDRLTGAEHPGAAEARDTGPRAGRHRRDQLRPDLSAKKIRGAHATPSTIGVLALDTVTTPFSVEITLSIEETARAHGWNSFVVNMFSDDRPEAVVDLLLSHRPDGIIFTTMGLRQVPLPEKTADSALRAGQLRKPQPAGGQLYPGR